MRPHGLAPALLNRIALQAHYGRITRPETEFGDIEDSIDHVALSERALQNAVVDEFRALARHHEERR